MTCPFKKILFLKRSMGKKKISRWKGVGGVATVVFRSETKKNFPCCLAEASGPSFAGRLSLGGGGRDDPRLQWSSSSGLFDPGPLDLRLTGELFGIPRPSFAPLADHHRSGRTGLGSQELQGACESWWETRKGRGEDELRDFKNQRWFVYSIYFLRGLFFFLNRWLRCRVLPRQGKMSTRNVFLILNLHTSQHFKVSKRSVLLGTF